MGPDDRRTKLRPLRLVTLHATAISLRAGPMVLSCLEIHIVMARNTTNRRREILPVTHLGTGMAGRAVSVFLGNRFRHHHLRRCDGGKIRHALPCSDCEIRLSFLHSRKILTAMNLMDKKFEVQTLTAFGIGELSGMTKSAITNFSRRASVRPEWVVTVVT